MLLLKKLHVENLLKDIGLLKKEENVFSLDYSIPDIVFEKDEYKKAYIRGAFLGGGSISNPEKTYHLEFVTHNENYAHDLSNLINEYGLNSKVIQRKTQFYSLFKRRGTNSRLIKYSRSSFCTFGFREHKNNERNEE